LFLYEAHCSSISVRLSLTVKHTDYLGPMLI